LPLRIGIHVGDVVVQGDDLMGDGVNIAARIEGVADAGGIAISRAVHEQVRDKLDLSFIDKGEVELKNLARPVQVFALGGTVPSSAAEPAPALALPDKPSIAVLPFQNMSGDPEQEYFADGISEDIITELTRFRTLFVIARNSSFSYKGKSPDLRAVGRELGVRYVLEGSVRKVGNRIRLTGQLIDAQTGSHIWAERYDRQLDDVFMVQEELTRSIVRAIAPHISNAEHAKVRRRRPGSLGAYEIAVRAHAKALDAWVRSDRALCDEAISEARAALAIDPDSTLALHALSFAQVQHLGRGTAADRQVAWRDGMAAVERCIAIDGADGAAHTRMGVLLIRAPGGSRFGEALDCVQRGFDLNPNDVQSLLAVAFVETLAGNPEHAIDLLKQVLRISPRDPARPNIHQQLSLASFTAKQYADGVAYALRGINEAPRLTPLYVFLATSYVGLDQIEEARAAMATARQLGPEFVERHLSGNINGRDTERARIFARIAAGLEAPSAADALR